MYSNIIIVSGVIPVILMLVDLYVNIHRINNSMTNTFKESYSEELSKVKDKSYRFMYYRGMGYLMYKNFAVVNLTVYRKSFDKKLERAPKVINTVTKLRKKGVKFSRKPSNYITYGRHLIIGNLCPSVFAPDRLSKLADLLIDNKVLFNKIKSIYGEDNDRMMLDLLTLKVQPIILNSVTYTVLDIDSGLFVLDGNTNKPIEDVDIILKVQSKYKLICCNEVWYDSNYKYI